MISRRLIRVKVLQVLYAYLKSEKSSLNIAEKELFFSLNKSYDLYFYLFLLILEIQRYGQKRIDLAKQKKRPTPEDLDPNMRFVENKCLTQIENNFFINKHLAERKLSWINYSELISKLYREMEKEQYFIDYMEAEDSNYKADKKLLEDIFTRTIAPNDDIMSILEEQSIYWNDDLEFVISMILRTISKFKESSDEYQKVMPQFKNDEDDSFAKRLLRKSILKGDEYLELIKKYAKNWELERIADMDIIIMQQAITEVVEFPSIPTRVTFNEYIEIAKFYSTNKSSVFINGILDKAVQELKEKNIVKKQGRGLIGEV